MKNQIEMRKGTTYLVAIRLTEGGDPYTLQDGERVILGIKRTYSAKHIFIREMEAGDDGIYFVELKPSDTVKIPAGNYIYDISLDTGDDFYKPIEEAAFIVHPSVTEKGDC